MHRIIAEDIDKILSASIDLTRFYGKTILISGANGYVPAYFVHTFLGLNDQMNAGIRVLALCRNQARAEARFADYLSRDDFALVIQDVCSPIAVEEDVHVFLHAASPAGIRTRHQDPVNTFLANVKGAENMLNLAIQNPCQAFLFLSSVDVYGDMKSPARLTEEQSGYLDPLNVRNAYACGKRAAESLCKAYGVKYQLPVYVVRPFQIMGPGPELQDGRLHIDFVSQMLDKGQIVLKSDGSAVRSFLYITDAVTAILTVLCGGNPGEAYNIVSETGELSVKELAELMASCVAGKVVPVIFDYAQRDTIEVTSALSVVTGDSAKLRNLGWAPAYSVAEGSSRMMQYYGIATKA